MKLSYKFKVNSMDDLSLRKEIVTVAKAGDSEKLKYLARIPERNSFLSRAIDELIYCSTPQALAFFIDVFPWMNFYAADTAVASGRSYMVEVAFPKISQASKDNLLTRLISTGEEKSVSMAQLLIQHGANLEQALMRVEAGSLAERAEIEKQKDELEQKKNQVKSLAAKLKPPSA